ncbi:Uncharacterised protein [Mycobacterium tuberculosis]|nr:Uncharacterised protein [Mycobacterium tuberculosis]
MLMLPSGITNTPERRLACADRFCSVIIGTRGRSLRISSCAVL